MRQENVKVVSRGWRPLSIIGILFVVLKLVGEHFHTPVADWSWWWVTCPFWLMPAIGLGIAFVGFVVGFVCIVLAALLDNHGKTR